ncbi:trans-sialidase, partial [Trypanosoma conorhini]
ALDAASIGLHNSFTELSGGGGSGVVLEDGTLVFPMQAIKTDGKSVLLVMRLESSNKKWTLSRQTTGAGCRDPSITRWGEVLAMAHCAGGYYDVYKSTAAGTAWFGGAPISRVWGNSLKRQGGHGVQSGLTTASIEDMEVVLLTAPVYSKEGDAAKGQLHLWLADGARVHDAGPVSDAAHNAAASSLLYKSGGAKEEELILLYEKKNGDGDSYDLVAVSLTDRLPEIKKVVRAWKELDAALKGCTPTTSLNPKEKGMCSGPVPTDGLVGFLSNTLDQTAWVDEYRGVNATVKGGQLTRTERGVTFKGSGSWAEWPVGSRGQNQPYYFANNKFTLAATVMIHAVPEADTPLLGVRMNDSAKTVLFGLSYTPDSKWKVTVSGQSRRLPDDDETWEVNRAYQVAVKMNTDDEFAVYVDGDEIYEGTYGTSLFDSHRISHFYFGGDGAAASATASPHVTVANVLLYNDELFSDGFKKLTQSKVALPKPAAEKEQVRGPQAGSSLPTSGSGTSVPEVGPEVSGGEEEGVEDVLAPAVPPLVAPESHAGPKPPEETAAKNASSQGPGAPALPADKAQAAAEEHQSEKETNDIPAAQGKEATPPPPAAGEGHGANDGGKLSPERQPAPKAEEQEEGESEVRSDDVVSEPLPPPSPSPPSSVSAPAEEGEDNAVVGAPEGAGAEQPPVLEAKDAAPTSAAGPGASPPVRSDADEAPTKSTPGTAPHGTVQPTAAEAEKATQGRCAA